MNITLISEYCKEISVGGTENYLSYLAEKLVIEGHNVLVISQGNDSQGSKISVELQKDLHYTLELLPREFYNRNEIKLKETAKNLSKIINLIEGFKPDVIHFHTLSTFFHVNHIQAIRKKYNGKMIFTSHIPGHLCMRGDMIRNGKSICDGIIGVNCIMCSFSKGVKNGLSHLVNRHHIKQLKRMRLIEKLNVHIVCVSNWQKQQLMLNGFKEENCNVIRQPFVINDEKLKKNDETIEVNSNQPMRLGYLGRFSSEKGTKLFRELIEELHGNVNFEFHIACPENSNNYDYHLIKKISDLSNRITIYNHIRENNKIDFFSKIDLLIVPSFSFETGPMVVQEALVTGTNSLVPNIGGANEYHKQYPEKIATYEWNNLKSLIAKIHHLKSIISKDNLSYLTTNEINSFLKEHLYLYEK